MSNSRKFKILCLDGGGVRGAYAANFLAEFEKPLKGSVGEYFDLIVGTSTGAILGGALAKGESASRVAELYSEKSQAIFKRRFWRLGHFKAKYSARELERELDHILDGKTFGELDTALCITALNASRGSFRVFKTPHWKKCYFDREILVKDAVLASAAAPTFFPGRRVPNDDLERHFGGEEAIYVDGGLIANNPVFLALSEALNYFELKGNYEIKILSLGTGGPGGMSPKSAKKGGLFNWGKKLVTHPLEIQGPAAHDSTRLLAKSLGNIRYIRCAPIPAQDYSLDSLDALQELSELGRIHAQEHGKTLEKEFFSTKAPPLKKYNKPRKPLEKQGKTSHFWFDSEL